MAKLSICPRCSCAIKRSEVACPHCGASLHLDAGVLPRAATAVLLGLTAASTVVACEETSTPAYGTAGTPGATVATGAGGGDQGGASAVGSGGAGGAAGSAGEGGSAGATSQGGAGGSG